MAKLSILIPSRHEELLGETIKNILANIEDDTEIIVGLDGAWPETPLESHDRLKVYYSPKVLGQRGMQNQLARLSRAKYVAKTDAHCAFDKGFDKKLLEAVEGHDDWTIVPAMKNLHAYNWVCSNCEREFYQGEKPDKCPDESCQFIETTFSKKIYFEPRTRENSGRSTPTSTAYRFTPDRLQFKYFNALERYQKDEVSETMSLQGSFFMCTREKYWELTLADETWGGWGQQGTEVALKTWLSGGRVVVHKGTWYAHMFRTNDQVAFPWNKGLEESQGKQQQRARKACVDLFKNNAWDKQTRGLSWLIERFWQALQEEPSNTDGADRKWTKDDVEQLKQTEGRFRENKTNKGILYFTDNELPLKYARPVQRTIKQIAKELNMELVTSSRKPMDWGKNVVTPEPRGYLTMFKQILKGLEAMESDIVFMAEHDVIYPKEHFTEFTPQEGTFAYDQNWWKVHADGFAIHWDAEQVSGLCAYRKDLITYYQWRIATFDKDNFDRKFEPYHDNQAVTWKASRPHIDIRHGRNLTYNKRSIKDFRKKEAAKSLVETNIKDILGWENNELLQQLFD